MMEMKLRVLFQNKGIWRQLLLPCNRQHNEAASAIGAGSAEVVLRSYPRKTFSRW
jgi:hypothetical protein